jgi:hypothetical protein
MQILVRKRVAEDLPFIFDSWMKSWRINKYAGCIPNHLYFETQRTLIEDLLARGADLLVAYPEGKEDIIIGWVCGEVKEDRTVLHYLYIKDPYLGLGLAERLIGDLRGIKPGFITHKLPFKELKSWRHVPEIARRKAL